MICDWFNNSSGQLNDKDEDNNKNNEIVVIKYPYLLILLSLHELNLIFSLH